MLNSYRGKEYLNPNSMDTRRLKNENLQISGSICYGKSISVQTQSLMKKNMYLCTKKKRIFLLYGDFSL
jgi:hypothetical protein